MVIDAPGDQNYREALGYSPGEARKIPEKSRLSKDTPDLINHPPHYNTGKFETIDVVADIIQFYPPGIASFDAGQVIKYVARAPHKGSYFQDLQKAQWYLTHLIALAKVTDGRE